PVAHENDAERAVRAAMEIAAGIGELTTPAGQPLHVRIGVATGRVIISELLSGRAADRHGLTGPTPSLAARLQALAPTDGVVVSEVTHEHVQSIFAFEDLGQVDLKGFTAQQHAFRLQGELPPESFGGGHRAARLTPLFGRETDLATIEAAWAAVR